jgi:hypothetical protein
LAEISNTFSFYQQLAIHFNTAVATLRYYLIEAHLRGPIADISYIKQRANAIGIDTTTLRDIQLPITPLIISAASHYIEIIGAGRSAGREQLNNTLLAIRLNSATIASTI